MISVLKNVNEFCYAYVEWYVLGPDGQFDEDGDYLYINDLWIHPDKRQTKVLNNLIYIIDKHPLSYSCKWVYWKNLKHKERLTKSFSRKRLSKLGEKRWVLKNQVRQRQPQHLQQVT